MWQSSEPFSVEVRVNVTLDLYYALLYGFPEDDKPLEILRWEDDGGQTER